MPTSALADRFFAGFYQHRAPETAAAALEGFLDRPPNNPRRVAKMFVRAIQIDAGVRAAFTVLARQRPELAPRITDLVAMADRAALPDPRTAPLREPADLDFQWAEFLLTGDAAPVERIVSVLGRPDLSLQSLTVWANQKTRLPWRRRARQDAAARLEALGFGLDTAHPTLGNTYDLDLAIWKCMADGNNMTEVLPFSVDEARINHLMMKGSACWSLQSNATLHPVVQQRYARLDTQRLPRFT